MGKYCKYNDSTYIGCIILVKMAKKVLVVGADNSSKGGIASVVKLIYKASRELDLGYELSLLKTTNYKSSTTLGNGIVFFKSIFKFLRYIMFEKINIIHFHSSSGRSYYRTYILLVLAKLFQKKTVLHLHSSNFDEFFINKRRLLVSHGLTLSDVVLVLCRDWYVKLKSKYSLSNIYEVNNPVEIPDYIRIWKYKSNHKFRILFLGFIIESKGIRDLISVAQDLYYDMPNVEFIIGGKGELEYLIFDYIEKHNKNCNMIFKGWVVEEEKEKLFKLCDLLFLPSYNEGMPMVILEAISNKLPVISTNISGIPQVVKDGINGYLFNPGDIDNFVNVIKKLSSDKELLKTFSMNSYKIANSFHYKKIFKEVSIIYKEIDK